MLGLFHCWQFYQARLLVKNTKQNLEKAKATIQEFEDNIQENIDAAKRLEIEIEEMTSNAQSVIFKYTHNEAYTFIIANL